MNYENCRNRIKFYFLNGPFQRIETKKKRRTIENYDLKNQSKIDERTEIGFDEFNL